jgi:hypothetical protein
MPSKLPQLNMRLQPDVIARLERVRLLLRAEHGHDHSQPDAVAVALKELEKKLEKKHPDLLTRS